MTVRTCTCSTDTCVRERVLRVCVTGLHHYGSAVAAFSPTSPMRGGLVGIHATTAANFLPGTSPPVGMSYLPAHAAAHTPHGSGGPHFVHASHVMVSKR